MSSSYKFDSVNSNNKWARKFAELKYRRGYTMDWSMDEQPDDEMLVGDKKRKSGIYAMIIVTFFSLRLVYTFHIITIDYERL